MAYGYPLTAVPFNIRSSDVSYGSCYGRTFSAVGSVASCERVGGRPIVISVLPSTRYDMLKRFSLWPVFLMLLATFTSCVSAVPKGSDFADRPIAQDDIAFTIDMELLSTAQLPDSLKAAANAHLQAFRRVETSLNAYIKALEGSLNAIDDLNERYNTWEAIIGTVSGITAIGVLFASAAVVVPILGAVAVLAGVGVQHYSIVPTERDTRRRLDEAKRLADQLPDIERAFDALLFAGDETEATRRYKRWEAYLIDFEDKTRQFFSRYAGGR